MNRVYQWSIGFVLSALLIFSLPRLVRWFFRSFLLRIVSETLTVVLAGFLTDKLVRFLVEDDPSRKRSAR